jgi:hypothetical protein
LKIRQLPEILRYNGIMENQESFSTPPSLEKVQGVIEKLTDGADCVVVKEKYDEAGTLVELEVKMNESDSEGNIRQFDYLVNKSGRMTLDEVWFDGDGMPMGGRQVAEFRNGNWEMG